MDKYSISSESFPALYQSANNASNDAQRKYLNLLRFEYFLLFCAALFSMNWTSEKYYNLLYALTFILASVVLLFRSVKKPEQDWYKCRALAESIKTTSWRYMMRSDPFNDAESIQIPRAEFRNYLKEILRSNHHIGESISAFSAYDDQLTSIMEDIRLLPLNERKEFYRKHRIEEQRKWYSKKAGDNKKAFGRWVRVTFFVYLLAILTVLLRIVFPEVGIWPTSPLTILAASIIGWIQIKKFNELSSSYTLTAHEIGIIQGRIDEISNEEDFSEFVNEAELAFSREHTQWVARQSE